MNLPRAFRRMSADQRGASAAEFALVLPLLLLFLFGIIDAGRLYYNVNQAEKATQMGARYAIVTDVIPPKIAAADYVGAVACSDPASPGSYKACKTGDAITDPSALGSVTCTSNGCTGTGNYPSSPTMNAGAFQNLVDRMHAFDPAIGAGNVSVSFRGSGLGYAGDPTGMDVVPLVTVQLTNLSFRPITALALMTVTLPPARTTLSAESSAGTQSN
jgi:Flp pilus assembly protein TadG